MSIVARSLNFKAGMRRYNVSYSVYSMLTKSIALRSAHKILPSTRISIPYMRRFFKSDAIVVTQ